MILEFYILEINEILVKFHKRTHNMKRAFLNTLMVGLMTACIFAQHPQVSTEPHKGSVVGVHPYASDSFFTIGEDGFVTKWSTDDIGEHFQIADSRITLIATNPSSSDIALAITDGGSIHKVEVMDWATSTRKYTKQFKEPVVSITYSSKGRFLFITTGEVQGNYILDALTGKLIKRIDQITTRIGGIQTDASEKAAFIYCPLTGKLIYYDLTEMIIRKTFSSETFLEQVRFFGVGEKSKNRFIAGLKNNTLYIIDANGGKTLYSAALKSPLLADSADKSAIYYTTSDKTVVLSKVSESSLLQKLNGESSIISPETVSSFTNLSAKLLCSVGIRNELSIFFGMTDGSVYRATKGATSYELKNITKKMYNRILDIASISGKVYLLTADGLYKTSYDDKETVLVGKTNGQTNFMLVDDTTAILWSRQTRNAIQKLNIADGTLTTLFVPTASVTKMHQFQRNLVYTLSNSRVERFNIDTSKRISLYAGNSVEDAVMLTANTLYIAKAVSSSIDSPLLSKSISSGETASLKVDGYVAFSIDSDFDAEKNIYGIALKEVGGLPVTQVFKYFPAQRKSVDLLKFNQEDQDAFVQLKGNTLYTNLGKHQVYAYDLETGKVRMYRRTSSLPRKISSTDDRLVFLNGDGGIAWYNPLSQTPMAQWYMSLDGKWIEF